MMIAASMPEQRPPNGKLLAIDREGHLRHCRRRDVVAPVRTGRPRHRERRGDDPRQPHRAACAIGAPHRSAPRRTPDRWTSTASSPLQLCCSASATSGMRTEDRPPPPSVAPGDRLVLGPLCATVTRRLHDHPRLVVVEFEGSPAAIWEGLARHGRPIQYAHVTQPLALWDTWTPIAGAPVAFEPPSAGFALDWQALASMRTRRVRFATMTHAAGLSSTGDPELDALLPFDEPYRIPARTAWELRQARTEGRRIIAIGTTVVRALEHAAARDGIVRAGNGVATQRIGPSTHLRVVDAILSGTHERGSSHYELLRAFADEERSAASTRS